MWVKNYADFLYNFALQRVNDEEQAHDLVQDTFLSALEKMDTFEGNSSELTWLRSILRNKIIDFYRKKASSRMVKISQDADEGVSDFFDENGIWKEAHIPKPFAVEGHDRMNTKEFYSMLAACMKKMPGLWTAVFTMKFMDEEKTENICKSLRITASNCWVVIHRAKLSLRECIQRNWL